MGYVQIQLLKVGKQKLLNLAKCDFHRMDITLAHIGKDTPKKKNPVNMINTHLLQPMKKQENSNQCILYTTLFLPSLLSSLPYFLCSSSPYLFCLCFIKVGSVVVQAALQLLYSQGLPCIPDPLILASGEKQVYHYISFPL